MDTQKQKNTEDNTQPRSGDENLGIEFSDTKKEEPQVDTRPAGPVRSSLGEAIDVSGADDSEIGGGTIVTDKKRRGGNVFSVLRSAAGQWAGDKTDAVKNMEVFQRPEAPKVRPGTERKEVIQKAVHNVQQVAHDDHKAVLQRIKTFQQDAERITGKPFTIKPREGNTEASWTHVVGDGDDASASVVREEVETPVVRREKITASGTAPQVDERSAATITDYASVPEQDVHRDDLAVKKEAEKIAPKTDVRTEVAREPIPPAPTTPIPPPPPPAPKKPPAVPQPAPNVAPPPPPKQKRQFPTRMVGLIAIGVLALTAIGGIITGGVYFFNNRTVEIQAPTVSFFAVDTYETLPLPGDRATLLGTATTVLQNSSARTIELRFVHTTLDSETPATTAEIFSVLQPRAPGALIRSLEDRMMLGGVGTGAEAPTPFIILTSHAFDIVFAGMIEWEQFISADLAPLFGPIVTRSFDEDARTIDGTVPATFIDDSVGDKNVRVLRDETGEVRMLYSFIDRTTIVITQSESAFLDLLDRLE